MSEQTFQSNLCKDLEFNEIDYEEINWDDFANLDMIDDLSEGEPKVEIPYVEVKKVIPKINLETQTLMETYKNLLKWVTVTVDQPLNEYPEIDYPSLSTKVESKGSHKPKFATKTKRLNPPVIFTQPYGVNFQMAKPANRPSGKPVTRFTTRPLGKPTTRPSNRPSGKPQGIPKPAPKRPLAQPLMALNIKPIERPSVQPLMALNIKPIERPSVQPLTAPKKVLNKLCFSFFKKVTCTKQACPYAHSVKEVDNNTIECKHFAKDAKCPLVEVVGHSKEKRLRYLKNLDERLCYGRHNHNNITESVHSYISRTTRQFDVIQLAKQIKAAQGTKGNDTQQ